ncbi:LANO_0B07250g1_1 [Lachancea nothofagi CBS 11611]|uniref:LANO_0B07250g1_1 n=1 Tax=Lachancea nothofagi CBS 11611 TaxID=1266666 RepID=A0A1G4IZK0_9SACH|nr:LANO_0B07250g1_1 [Lachancea nothofagi CBS 11611]
MSDELTPTQLIDEIEKPQSPGRVIKDLVAGTAGGIAQVLVGQPFDTTKVRLQTSSAPTSAVEVVKNLEKNEGLRGFYKGTLTPLIGVGACVSCQFGVNEAMKRFFMGSGSKENSTLSLPHYYTCGLVGGVANSFLASPIEHVRIRLQTQTGSGAMAEFKGPLDCIKKLNQNKALMRGLTPTIIREAQGCGAYFLTYEALVANQIQKGIARSDIPTWKLCLFGAVSGTALWLSVYPLDVIKSIMQTDKLGQPTHGKNMVQVARIVYAKYGWKAFFKGFGPTMLRAAPANGATFATFELAMRSLG